MGCSSAYWAQFRRKILELVAEGHPLQSCFSSASDVDAYLGLTRRRK
jgi:hypothetical protein